MFSSSLSGSLSLSLSLTLSFFCLFVYVYVVENVSTRVSSLSVLFIFVLFVWCMSLLFWIDVIAPRVVYCSERNQANPRVSHSSRSSVRALLFSTRKNYRKREEVQKKKSKEKKTTCISHKREWRELQRKGCSKLFSSENAAWSFLSIDFFSWKKEDRNWR